MLSVSFEMKQRMVFEQNSSPSTAVNEYKARVQNVEMNVDEGDRNGVQLV